MSRWHERRHAWCDPLPFGTHSCLDSVVSITAYPKSDAWLKNLLDDANIDVASLERRLSRCDLRRCKGMCCNDGVYVDEETAEGLRALARDEAAFFANEGVTLPAEVIVEGAWRGEPSGTKTAVRPRDVSSIEGYPAHFPATACVFMSEDGRCSLESLARARDEHPWHYKPLTCWMHPLTIDTDAWITLRVHDEKTDPHRYPDYDGFVTKTRCGATDPNGAPARETLREELEVLGAIVGRDFASAAIGEDDDDAL